MILWRFRYGNEPWEGQIRKRMEERKGKGGEGEGKSVRECILRGLYVDKYSSKIKRRGN